MNITGMDISTVFAAATGVAEPVVVSTLGSEGTARRERMLAADPTTLPGVLESLSEMACPSVLELVATNPSTPTRVLDKLSQHVSSQVRMAVAEHRGTPREIIEKLALDCDADVRYALAENHLLPQDILRTLSQDENPYVAARAERTLSRLTKERSQNVESNAWKRFRSNETRRRLLDLFEDAGTRPINQVSRFFANLCNYARAF